MKRICVFCGSQCGTRQSYADQAKTLGRALTERQTTLVYGGGSIGLMGVIADTVLATGGEVIGVIPQKLAKKEVMHQSLTELRVVGSMHERKALMSELSDAFVAMPGGFGTLEEILEVITWGQLGIQSKPIGLLNVEGYFDHLLGMVDRGVEVGFIRPVYRDLFCSESDARALLDRFQSFRPLPPILEEMGIEDT